MDDDALQTAAGVGRSLLAVKLAVPGAALFLAFLIALGAIQAIVGGNAASAAIGCGNPGLPSDQYGDPTKVDSGQLEKQRIANAQIIDKVAAASGLPGRATLVALMAGLQESSLINLAYGTGDSVGIFQMSPSSGWGSKEQLLAPDGQGVQFAAGEWFRGGPGGSPPGLLQVNHGHWDTLSLNDAAQAVEQSAFPDLYGGQEDEARRIAKQAGIDLNRPGKNAGTSSASPNGGNPASGGGCFNTRAPGKPGSPFHDGNAAWPAQVTDPRSTLDAIAWARQQIDGSGIWYRACLAFVAEAYGWNYSGTQYAIDLYKVDMPASMRHDGDRNPPVGALMFWETSSRAGHVAIYIGNGQIISNDIRRPGYIDIAPATDPETQWGATYAGWSPPYFPHAG